MKIISERKLVECVRYMLYFAWKNDPNSGYAFDCDKNGNPELSTDVHKEIYQKCIDGTIDVVPKGIRKNEWHYWEPAVGECHCGCEVVLDGFTNTCDNCERDYNKSGQLLASREQWGSETGESLSDILRIP